MSKSFFRWLDQLTYGLSSLWTWLTTPLASNDNSVLTYASTPLALFTISTIFVILVFKIIHMFNPLV